MLDEARMIDTGELVEDEEMENVSCLLEWRISEEV